MFSIMLQHYLSYLDQGVSRFPIQSCHAMLAAAAPPASGDRAALTRP